ncbi:nucleoside triphosphate pyrophosphatase [Synechococcus sp. PCC 7336]|uniref:Maf family protein n=1 Tax=Synechococcus sp. PCC 7336 TaxID=195250 RepID=UPI00034BC4CF|nr:nucleoside triphosphate pyrophosphatase [Synechococcus sp. PCC 7336]
MLPSLILASQSPARCKLLNAAGLSFAVEPSDFDEDRVRHDDPKQLVEILAVKKAETVAARHAEAVVVLGADSLFVLNGEVYGKPEDAAESLQRLQKMQGNMGYLYTGHAAIDTGQQRQLSCVGVTEVYFAPMSETDIRRYIATGEPLACAGSFALDGLGGLFIDRIEGCHSNVIGISLPLVRQLLAELGYAVSDFWQ